MTQKSFRRRKQQEKKFQKKTDKKICLKKIKKYKKNIEKCIAMQAEHYKKELIFVGYSIKKSTKKFHYFVGLGSINVHVIKLKTQFG